MMKRRDINYFVYKSQYTLGESMMKRRDITILKEKYVAIIGNYIVSYMRTHLSKKLKFYKYKYSRSFNYAIRYRYCTKFDIFFIFFNFFIIIFYFCETFVCFKNQKGLNGQVSSLENNKLTTHVTVYKV